MKSIKINNINNNPIKLKNNFNNNSKIKINQTINIYKTEMLKITAIQNIL